MSFQKTIKAIISFLMLISEPKAFASNNTTADDIKIKDPTYVGSGCPEGTASVTIAPDEKSISFLFDQFHIQTGGETGKTKETKKCKIEIPMTVPSGYQMAIVRLDYRGYNFLPEGARTKLKTTHSFVYSDDESYLLGKTTSSQTKTFKGPLDENYALTYKPKQRIWSRCGGDFNLRIHSQMNTKTNENEDETISTVDSLDGSAKRVKYHYHLKPC